MRSIARYLLAEGSIAAAAIFGVGGLGLFVWFLLFGPPIVLPLGLAGAPRLGWDAGLSVLFFVQHSGMVRRSAQRWLGTLVPDPIYRALYGAASGIALLLVVLLWQPLPGTVWTLVPRWLVPPLLALVGAGFVWAAHSLGVFDLLGIRNARRWVRGRAPFSPPLAIRGPYRYVRHPFYSLTIVFLWSLAHATTDRLLFNVLWTVWIVVAAHFEERDLLAEFGESYRRYRRAVPMLIPWRRPRVDSA
jgi:methanethiol S-methyltransferase